MSEKPWQNYPRKPFAKLAMAFSPYGSSELKVDAGTNAGGN